MKLYNLSASPNARKPRLVASELGIPLELVEVDIRKGENRTPEFLAKNPNGQMPVLQDGDFFLTLIGPGRCRLQACRGMALRG